jgi:hypothetical protein
MEVDGTMNRAEEHSLAWALAQAARSLLNPDSQARLYTKIGAGEQHDAIRDLLECYARNGIHLAPELDAQLWKWIAGYSGSDVEATLRRLVERVTVPPTERSEYDATIAFVRSLSTGVQPRTLFQ